MNFIYILLGFEFLGIIYSEQITLNLLTYSFIDGYDDIYSKLVKGFNEYSRERGLDIDINLTIASPETSPKDSGYEYMLDYLIRNKPKKYDIYFFFSAFSKKYSDYFINLRDYLPEESIEGFDKKLLREACSSVDYKLIGLPVYIDVSTLFSNIELLTKYNMGIPKTWEELMKTSKYIYEEEKKLNNTIIRYNGLFDDDNGSISLYEFINSYRESNDSFYPGITSESTVEALKKIKEMKEEIGEDIFRVNSFNITYNNLYNEENGNEKALFLKIFHTYNEKYKTSALPGRKEGVSGTVVIPSNIGISNYIDEARKKAATEFLKFVALKETQKNYIIGNYVYSANMMLYNDTEVCSILDCSIINSAYPLSIINNDVDLFGDVYYFEKYKDYMFEYIYNDKPLSEVLNNIKEMSTAKSNKANTSNGISSRNMGCVSFLLSLTFMLYWLIH